LRERNLFGEEEEILYVKGSGHDLETIDAAGFTPVPVAHLRRVAGLPALSDPQMVNELKTHRLRAGAPSPSVESLLHAILPLAYVDHTHADAVLATTRRKRSEEHTSKLQSQSNLVCRLLLEKKNKNLLMRVSWTCCLSLVD